jgi:hypothetical protein
MAMVLKACRHFDIFGNDVLVKTAEVGNDLPAVSGGRTTDDVYGIQQ